MTALDGPLVCSCTRTCSPVFRVWGWGWGGGGREGSTDRDGPWVCSCARAFSPVSLRKGEGESGTIDRDGPFASHAHEHAVQNSKGSGRGEGVSLLTGRDSSFACSCARACRTMSGDGWSLVSTARDGAPSCLCTRACIQRPTSTALQRLPACFGRSHCQILFFFALERQQLHAAWCVNNFFCFGISVGSDYLFADGELAVLHRLAQSWKTRRL